MTAHFLVDFIVDSCIYLRLLVLDVCLVMDTAENPPAVESGLESMAVTHVVLSW